MKNQLNEQISRIKRMMGVIKEDQDNIDWKKIIVKTGEIIRRNGGRNVDLEYIGREKYSVGDSRMSLVDPKPIKSKDEKYRSAHLFSVTVILKESDFGGVYITFNVNAIYNHEVRGYNFNIENMVYHREGEEISVPNTRLVDEMNQTVSELIYKSVDLSSGLEDKMYEKIGEEIK